MKHPLPPEPLLFLKPPSAILHPGGTIRLPRPSRRVDFEGEIGVVIGRVARSVPEEIVRLHVEGVREHQRDPEGGKAFAEATRSMLRLGRLQDVERYHILEVLKSTGGVVEGSHGAATILGMHPNTLRSRMKKLGIERSSLSPALPATKSRTHEAVTN